VSLSDLPRRAFVHLDRSGQFVQRFANTALRREVMVTT
jgi:hypothetical protein